MKHLSIDIETYSSVDLAKSGVYPYAASPDFRVLLFGYSADHGPVRVVDLANGEEIPPEVINALTDPECEKWAFNAMFERVCLSRHLGLPVGEYLPPEQWRCSMVWSATLSLPMSLKGVGAVLGLAKQKMGAGKELVPFFCTSEKDGTVHYAKDFPELWKTFKAYNIRDVETEQAIQQRLSRFPVPERIWKEYAIDQRINDRGVLLDRDLVAAALKLDAESSQSLTQRMQDLTGMENPNSAAQLKDWLAGRGIVLNTVGKKEVAALLKELDEDANPLASARQRDARQRDARQRDGSSVSMQATAKTVPAVSQIIEVLRLRQQIARSSVKKYEAMKNTACPDGRARGCFQFFGANRTGRFAGRLIQLQNLPQNHLSDLSAARELVKTGDLATVERSFGDVPDTLSQLIRTAFIPKEGTRFIVADYSAIEARVIAWYAGETWRQEVFASGGDIYCASASQMFGVPVEKHGVNGHLRQKGKIAELALGYGGSVGALKAMGAIEMGLTEDELQPLVDAWREANPNIRDFWWRVDDAAKEAIRHGRDVETDGLTFQMEAGMLFISLPSGRRLCYAKPKIGTNRFGGESITYMGIGPEHQWCELETYGPKLVENIVQATARDILCYAMGNLSAGLSAGTVLADTLKSVREPVPLTTSGCEIVMHIHDEVVIEAPPGLKLEDVCAVMGRTPSWAPGLKLRADGYECPFYQKD